MTAMPLPNHETGEMHSSSQGSIKQQTPTIGLFSASRSSVIQRRSVCFRSSVSVQRTICVDEMSDGELNATWYSRSEYKSIRRRESQISKAIAHKATPSSSSEENEVEWDGIDSVTQKLQSKKRIQRYIVAMLWEQERQWEKDRPDELVLASFSQCLTHESVDLALHRATALVKQIVDPFSIHAILFQNRHKTIPSLPKPRQNLFELNPNLQERGHTHHQHLPPDRLNLRWHCSSVSSNVNETGRGDAKLMIPLR